MISFPFVNRTRWIAGAMMLMVGVFMLGWWGIQQPVKNGPQAMALGRYLLASDYFSAEVAQGNPVAQNSLANLYYLGLGVEQDFEQAASLYFDAAKQGLASAQLNLGNLYKQGLGVEFDPMRAFAWFKMSDVGGNPMAELYMTQIAVEYTLGPMQINTASKKWAYLDALVAEGL